MVVDVILKEGQATASHIIVNSCIKLLEASENAGKIKITCLYFVNNNPKTSFLYNSYFFVSLLCLLPYGTMSFWPGNVLFLSTFNLLTPSH